MLPGPPETVGEGLDEVLGEDGVVGEGLDEGEGVGDTTTCMHKQSCIT